MLGNCGHCPRIIEAEVIPYTKGAHSGHRLSADGGRTGPFLVRRKPLTGQMADEPEILVGEGEADGDGHFTVSEAEWWPVLEVAPDASRQARASWLGAFRFVEESRAEELPGLRRPQIGALHAIHAHWSTKSDVATVVLPTGVGKTEVMLSTLVSARCERVLVIAPSDPLRTQIAEKFETLGMIFPGSPVLDETALWPVVGTLKKKPKTVNEALAFFERCNVVVATSQLLGGCAGDVQRAIAEWSSHLFIDEAHHSEAPTWKAFRSLFDSRRILQFTATRFREDGRRIDGSFIYTYPLKLAQSEGYFRPIRFHDVAEYDQAVSDRAIAEAVLSELDSDGTSKHIAMARVDSIARAKRIFALYQELGRHASVLVHSDLSSAARVDAFKALRNQDARIVVCVDMLGEGFDMPELKIAAFHDIRKSLAVTLQLAGRFTRTREDLGDPVFIANTAQIDVRDELQRLYAQDPDWNDLLPDLVGQAIEREQEAQRFFAGFDATPSELPLKDLRPSPSIVVYRTRCHQWTPRSFRNGISGLNTRSKVVSTISREDRTLVVMYASEKPLAWTDLESIVNWSWELLVAVWDEELSLLYVYGSNNAGDYKGLASALCGNDVELIRGDDVFRSFHDIKRLTLMNVGLNEVLGRNVSYTGRMGVDVERRTGVAARRGAIRAVVAGVGFERGEKLTLGASRKGRIWAHQRFSVDALVRWAKAQGRKLSDETISPEEVLAGTIKPAPINVLPEERVVAVDWPAQLWDHALDTAMFEHDNGEGSGLAVVDIEPAYSADGDLSIRVVGDDFEVCLALELFETDGGSDFRFSRLTPDPVAIRIGARRLPIEQFLTENAPTLWFADGASLEGCHYAKLPQEGLMPFPRDRIEAGNWDGTNIRSESQGENRRIDSVQRRVIEWLLADPSYQVIFGDDGSGEVADIVAIRWSDDEPGRPLEVVLYHCKYSESARPGGRVDDLYVVCGQAQRSVRWVSSHGAQTGLFSRLLRHEASRISRGRPTRFERGNKQVLALAKDMSRLRKLAVSVYVVQPGLSRAEASQSQLELLAVTERYLNDTYDLPFAVIGSA